MMSRQRPDLTSLPIPRAPKGGALPTAEPGASPLMQETERRFGEGGSDHASERHLAGGTTSPAHLSVVPPPAPPQPAPAPVPPVPIGITPPPPPERRVLIGARVRQAIEDRMRIFEFHSRMKRQDLVEKALDDFLAKHGV
jgi:hypothetical protein